MTRKLASSNIRTCTSCASEFRSEPTDGVDNEGKPSHRRHRKCPDCLNRACTDCGNSFVPSRHTSNRCGDCILLDNPRAHRCPFRYCLQIFVPDPRHPHDCGKGRQTNHARLAEVDNQPDLVVLHGPPVSDRAIGVVNPNRGPETLAEAQQADRRNAEVA